MMPSQKLGSETPSRANVVEPWSTHERGRSAAMIPAGNAMSERDDERARDELERDRQRAEDQRERRLLARPTTSRSSPRARSGASARTG